MIPQTHREAMKQFFYKTETGAKVREELERQIDANHREAENDPDHARDFTQRAKGVRDVLSYIQSAIAEPKKGKTPKV